MRHEVGREGQERDAGYAMSVQWRYAGQVEK